MIFDLYTPGNIVRLDEPHSFVTPEVAVPREIGNINTASPEHSDGFSWVPFAGIALVGIALRAFRNRETPWRDFLNDK